MLNITQHKFEPGAHSIIQMGEELIGHPTTAVNELVKNGYDADATKVTVYLHYLKNKNKSFIIIHDNGLGMNSETLFGDWLQPSVSKKRLGDKKSKIFNRSYLGSKGIGRLASMALGNYLTVISKTSEDINYCWLTIDRENFRKESLLSEIKFPGGITQNLLDIFINQEVINSKNGTNNPELTKVLSELGLAKFVEGTLIIVEVLDSSIRTIIEDEFQNSDVLVENMSLVRALRVLITPLYLNIKIQNELLDKGILNKQRSISLPESTFEINFGCNLLDSKLYPDNIIPIEEFEILENYDYRVLGKVDEDGEVNGFYYCNRLIEDSYDTTFSLTKEEVFSDESITRRKFDEINVQPRNSNVGDFFFDVRVFDRDPDSMDKLSIILKTIGRRSTGYMLDNFVGLRISKNGFGVKPYGEEDKDWMGMGEMRVQDPSAILGTNQIIGNIFLFSPNNDSLNEKTNREGFFENEAFITFKKVLRAILIETGKKRYNYRQKHNIGRKASSSNNRPDTTRFIELIQTLTSDQTVIKKAKTYINEYTTTLDNLENSLTFSQRLATLGSGLELVYHELAQPTSLIGKSLLKMRFPISRIVEQETRDELNREIKDIKAYIGTLDTLKESLEPAIGKGRKKEFKPYDTINKVCYLFTKDFVANEVTLKIDSNLLNWSIIDYEYHLWIALVNIFNNAMYWLKQGDNNSKQISIDLSENNQLSISNNGPKIEIGELENIFNYGVSYKKVKNATGLGLSYTRSVLTANGWEIWAENRDNGPSFILYKI